jgi:phosphoribosylamine--glycine ligase
MYDFDTDKYWLIEFNTRWGDPEAEVLLPNITNDYFELLYSAACGQFKSSTMIGFNRSFYVSAAVVTKGYPEEYSANLGQPITGLIDVLADGKVTVYGAGAKQSGPGYQTGSGRNLHLVATSESIAEARATLNKELSRLGGPIHFRRDIGAREDRYLERNHAQIDEFVRQHRQNILV